LKILSKTIPLEVEEETENFQSYQETKKANFSMFIEQKINKIKSLFQCVSKSALKRFKFEAEEELIDFVSP
jgi:hypothetical protein